MGLKRKLMPEYIPSELGAVQRMRNAPCGASVRLKYKLAPAVPGCKPPSATYGTVSANQCRPSAKTGTCSVQQLLLCTILNRCSALAFRFCTWHQMDRGGTVGPGIALSLEVKNR